MIRIYINNDFEANSTSLMSDVQWANVKFFPEPTGELYGWLLATLVKTWGGGWGIFPVFSQVGWGEGERFFYLPMDFAKLVNQSVTHHTLQFPQNER